MNRADFWVIVAAALANIVLLWTIWSGVADNTQAIAANTRAIAANAQAIAKGFADLHKELSEIRAELRVDNANLRTEMIRETFTNREDIRTIGGRVRALEESAGK